MCIRDRYGIAATPGVVIDGKVVHAGGLPKPAAVQAWLESLSLIHISEPTRPY